MNVPRIPVVAVAVETGAGSARALRERKHTSSCSLLYCAEPTDDMPRAHSLGITHDSGADYFIQAQKNNWKVGEKADETIHMELMAGPVTSSQPFTLEKDSPGKCARQ